MRASSSNETTRHEDFQMRLRDAMKLPRDMSVIDMVSKILTDTDIRYQGAQATEFLFGCEYIDTPVGNGNTSFGILFDQFYAGKNVELLKLISANHEWWAHPPDKDETIYFSIHPGEYFVILKPAEEQVIKFITSVTMI